MVGVHKEHETRRSGAMCTHIVKSMCGQCNDDKEAIAIRGGMEGERCRSCLCDGHRGSRLNEVGQGLCVRRDTKFPGYEDFQEH